MNSPTTNQSSPSFCVRDVPVFGDVILAPMAGFSDVPHRAICRTFGSSMSYTEFVAAEEILAGSQKLARLLDFTASERPVVFQIFGNNAQKIVEAAIKIEAHEPDIIDINMGCSTRRVSGRGAGVGMMPNLGLVAETFSLLSSRLTIPITGKIRLGWDDCQNFLEVARVMEENGASLVAIHPRTKEQKYRGTARWDAIGEVKQAVKIPVIGNGDVRHPTEIDQMLAQTGCDAVMIGRGAIGNPWIFGRIAKNQLSFSQVVSTIIEHLYSMLAYYGDPQGMILFRKHLKRYLQGMPPLANLYSQMIVANTVEALLALLAQADERYGYQKAADLKAG